MGSVLPKVPLMSLGASFAAGNWYGITVGDLLALGQCERV
jgi:hypothetical protein